MLLLDRIRSLYSLAGSLPLRGYPGSQPMGKFFVNILHLPKLQCADDDKCRDEDVEEETDLT
jgi:hypothetical protein